MDQSLWLLNYLKACATLRRWTRSFRTTKGLLLALVGSLIFLPLILSSFFTPRILIDVQIAFIRDYGPLVLFLYCILNVLFSSSDRVVYYSPSEVDFLFSGPYTPRQLLLYKIVAGLTSAVVTALFMTLATAHHTSKHLSAYAGLCFALVFLYLFSLAVGLVISIFGALAFSRLRQFTILALSLLAATILWPIGQDALSLPPMEILQRIRQSSTLAFFLLPFRPFVMAYTSRNLWPDLLLWSTLSLLIDFSLLALVLLLNTGFQEASAAASARIFQRLQNARKGKAFHFSVKVRGSLPMLPVWGGIGPNLWRHLISVIRSPSRIVGILFMHLVPVGFILFIQWNSPFGTNILAPIITMLLTMTMVATSTIFFDFRLDFEHIEQLKTLPIRPTRLVLGQLLTPVLILTAVQWIILALLFRLIRIDPLLLLAAAILIPPLNFLLIAIENMYFLLYPFLPNTPNSVDFQALGRQLLLMLAKLFTASVATGLSAGLAALTFWLTGESWIPTIFVAWLMLVVCGVGMIPVVAHFFNQFDVSTDRVG